MSDEPLLPLPRLPLDKTCERCGKTIYYAPRGNGLGVWVTRIKRQLKGRAHFPNHCSGKNLRR